MAGLLVYCHLALACATSTVWRQFTVPLKIPTTTSMQAKSTVTKPPQLPWHQCADLTRVPGVQFTALNPLLRAGDAACVVTGLVVSFSQLSDAHAGYINAR